RAFLQLDRRRLVILGEPGAGKTTLAVLLTVALSEVRAPGDPVPVLLSAASWRLPDIDTGVDVSPLTDTSRFPDRERIESHLLDSLVPTVFAADGTPADRATRWLRYLAIH